MPPRIQHSCVAVIGDLHVGSPENPQLEDFRCDDAFAGLLRDEIPKLAGGEHATLIINGDFIDFPQILPELGETSSEERLGTTEAESLRRVAKAVKGHPRVFAALRSFLEAGNQVLLLPGNHDIDLHFPTVLGAVREAVGAGVGTTLEPGFAFVAEGAIEERGVFIEHGNQYTYDNRFDHWSDPVRPVGGGAPRIERPWGTLFMDLVYNDIEQAYPFVNKVRPPWALALIILRAVQEDLGASTKAIARLVLFFVLHGGRLLWERAPGTDEATFAVDEAAEPGGVMPTRGDVETVMQELGLAMTDERRETVIDEVMASTLASGGPAELSARSDETVRGLLGGTDERGLEQRIRDLAVTRGVRVAVFGHTHEPEDRVDVSTAGACRVLNPGGWIPRIVVAPGTFPSLQELRNAKPQHDVRYAWLTLGEQAANGEGPAGTLVKSPSLTPDHGLHDRGRPRGGNQ